MNSAHPDLDLEVPQSFMTNPGDFKEPFDFFKNGNKDLETIKSQ